MEDGLYVAIIALAPGLAPLNGLDMVWTRVLQYAYFMGMGTMTPVQWVHKLYI